MPKSKTSKPVADAPVDDWQAHDDLRTLIEGHKIRKDKKRHGAAMNKHKEMLAALQAIAAQQQQAPADMGAVPMKPTANGGAF